MPSSLAAANLSWNMSVWSYILLKFRISSLVSLCSAVFSSFLCPLGAAKLFTWWFLPVILWQVVAADFSVLTELLPGDHDKCSGKGRSDLRLCWVLDASMLTSPRCERPWLSGQIGVTSGRTPSAQQGLFSFIGNNSSDSPDQFLFFFFPCLWLSSRCWCFSHLLA